MTARVDAFARYKDGDAGRVGGDLLGRDSSGGLFDGHRFFRPEERVAGEQDGVELEAARIGQLDGRGRVEGGARQR